MTEPTETEWPVSWEAHRQAQLESWLATTPELRLAWLERAILFAWEAGALRPQDDVVPDSPTTETP